MGVVIILPARERRKIRYQLLLWSEHLVALRMENQRIN
jgi:hypothetical protein